MTGDRMTSALGAFIRAEMRGVDYLALYPCKVQSQNSDGTLELKPDIDRIPPLSKVPMRGVIGIAVKVASGARCNLGWDGGDPQRPFATNFEVGGIDTLYLGTANATGSDATNFVALANLVLTELQSISSKFNGHTHLVSTTGSATAQSGTAAAVLLPQQYPSPSTVAATKVKAR